MNTIDRELLKERLIGEGYIEDFNLNKTIDNLLNLKKLSDQSAYEMLVKWMSTGKLTDFEPIEGIDKSYLRGTLKMKAPAIILAYGMLLVAPKENAIFLKNQATRRKSFKFNSNKE